MSDVPQQPIASTRYAFGPELKAIRGGQGQFFTAIDNKFDRQVLIKKLRPGVNMSEDNRARFERETKVTARLQHPGVVPIHDYFQDEEGNLCCVMESVVDEQDGQPIIASNLEQVLERRTSVTASRSSSEFRRYINILIDVCLTVSYAHRHSLIHRDLKCTNILVTQDRVLVIDWGLVRILSETDQAAVVDGKDAKSPEDERLTTTGRTLGTKYYKAPEQKADATIADERSDVYSLGAVLYRILTDELPEDDFNAIVPPRSLNRSVSIPLAAICSKAMALRPEDRYQSPDDLAADLSSWLRYDRITAHPARLDRFWGAVQRHQWLATTAIALILTCVVGLAVGSIMSGRSRKSLAEANARLDTTASENLALAKSAQARLVAFESQQYANALANAFGHIVEYDSDAARNLLQNPARCPEVHREFGWHLLAERAEKGRQAVRLDSVPRRVAFTNAEDSPHIVPGMRNGQVVKWGVDRLIKVGEPLLKRSDETRITTLATRPGHADIVAVGFNDGLVMVLDGDPSPQRLQGRQLPIQLLEWSESSDRLIIGDRIGLVVYDTTSWNELAEMSVDRSLKIFDFDPQRNLVALCMEEGIDLRNPEKGTCRHFNAPNVDETRALNFTRVGDGLTQYLVNGSILHWRLTEEEPTLERVEPDVLPQIRLCETGGFPGDSITATMSSHPGLLVRRDLPELQRFQLIQAPRRFRQATCLAVSPSGRWIASGCKDGSFALWDLSPLRASQIYPELSCNSAIVPTDGDNIVFSWTTHRGELCHRTREGAVDIVRLENATHLAAGSPDGRNLALLDQSGRVTFWNAGSRAASHDWNWDDPVLPDRMAFMANSDEVVVANRALVRIVNWKSGQVVSQISPADVGLDGFILATPTREPNQILLVKEPTLLVYDTLRGETVSQITFRGPIRSFVLPLGDDEVLAQHAYGRFRRWDLSTGKMKGLFTDQHDTPTAVAMSLDLRTFAIGTWNGEIHLIDPNTGTRFTTLEGPAGKIVGLAFSRDGNHLAAGSANGVFVWSVSNRTRR
ncbi:MAG: protein kinase [Planctomycetales bacterium]|nr:protein kinase [Planctomycetales bacterium]